MKEKQVTLKPYDHEVQNDVYDVLFCGTDHETEQGFTEIPAASYQLIVSALELIRWDAETQEDRDIIRKATGLVERYRDQQKRREWKRKQA